MIRTYPNNTRIIKMLALVFVVCCSHFANAQTTRLTKVRVVKDDGTVITRYQYNSDGSPVDTNVLKTLPLGKTQVNSSKKSTFSIRNSSATLLSSGGGGGSYGCSLSGSAYDEPQTWYTYTLSCSTYPSTVYWEVSDGGEGYSEDGVSFMMQWLYGFTSGTITAYDGSYTQIGFISVTILTPPPLSAGSITSSNVSYCFSGGPGYFSVTTPSGGTCSGSYGFQWQYSNDNSNWYDISGASYAVFDPGTVYTTTYYRRKVTCNGSTDYTNAVLVTINNVPAAPTIYISSGSSYLCDGANAVISSSGSSITWNTGGSGNSKTVYSAGSYVAYDNNGCGASAGSNTISIATGNSPTTPSISASSTLLCDGATTSLHASESVAATLDWYTSAGTYVGSGADISGVGAGTYYVHASNACSSANSALITLNSGTSPSAPSVSSGQSLVCNGATTTLYASEPVSTSFDWYTSGGTYIGSGSSLGGIGGGTYYVKASNSCSYTYSGYVSITADNSPTTPSVSAGSMLVCNGGTTTLYGSSTGSIAWYNSGSTYLGSGNSISGIGGGMYYAVASNSCGSAGSGYITISADNTPSAPTISANRTSLCDGQTATLSSTGSNITWSNDFTGNSITVDYGGSFHAVQSNGCGTSAASNTLVLSTGTTPQTPTISPSATLLCDGATATLTASESVSSTLTWYTLSGTYARTGSTVSGIGPGTYYVIASTPYCGSAQSSNVTLYAGSSPSVPLVSAGSYLLCDGATTTLTASGTGTIDWYTSGGIYLGNGTSISNIGGGSYYAKATNSCGIVTSSTITINTGNTPSAPVVSAGSMLVCNGGTTTLYGSSTGTIAWYNSGSTYLGSGNSISGIGGGMYYAVASNSCGSAGSGYITISADNTPSAPTISANRTLLCDGQTATLSATGSNITWSNDLTGNSITVDYGGSFHAVQSNGCGTSAASNTLVLSTGTTPQTPTISPSATLLCDGATATLTASESVSSTLTWYTLSGTYVGTGSTVSGIGAGTYYVVASTSCGTAQSSNVTLYAGSSPSVPLVSAGSYLLCDGATTTLTASGTGSINWYTSGGSYLGNGTSISSIGGGSYYATAITSCGTTTSSTININTGNTPSAPVVSAGSVLLCNGESTTLSSTGSDITWNTGATESVITVSAAGNYYSVQHNACGTSAPGNTITISTLSTPSAPVISAGGPTSFCNGNSVILSATGANILWSDDHTGTQITVSSAGTFWATASNTCGTSSNSNIITTTVLTVPSVAAITGTTVICKGSSATLSDATPGGSWSSSNTGIATVDANGVVTGVGAGSADILYTVTNSCGSTVVSISFTVNNTPSGSISPAAASFCGSGTLTAPSASGYQWYLNNSAISGATSQSYMATASGIYSVLLSNANGCSAISSNTVDVSIIAIPATPVISSSSATFCGEGMLNSSGSGNFQWYKDGSATGGNNSSLSVTQSGAYTVTVTTAGCTSSVSSPVSITVNAIPSAGTITGNTQVCEGTGTQLLNTAGGGSWSSSNTAIATVDGGGFVQGVTAGSVIIYYTVSSNGCNSSSSIGFTVNAQPSVPVISGANSIAVGSSINYSADLTGGLWSSSNASVATIGSLSGDVTAVTAGTVTLHYVYTTGGGCTASADKTISVYPSLQIPVIAPVLTTADALGNGQMLSATGISGGQTGTYTLQWQFSTDGTSWSNISGANGNTYLPVSISNNTYYRLVVQNGSETVYSNTATVKFPLNGGQIAASPAVVSSGGSSTLVSTQDAAGGTGSFVYRYETSPDRIHWDSTGSSVNNLSEFAYYRRRAASGTDTAWSNTITIRIAQPDHTNPDNSTGPVAGSAEAVALPAGTSMPDNENRNFVRSRTVNKPGITTANAANALNDAYDIQQATTYFDGLGRQEQTVAWKQTPLQKDLVSVHVYDPFGREAQQYLPYTDAQDSGHYRTTANVQQPAFYNSRFSNTENYYYSNTVFEKSPLNRALKITAPGNSFTGSNRGVTHITRFNERYDSVHIWNMNDSGMAANAGEYLPGTLVVDETTDEQNNTVITYTDKSGLVILKKVQVSDTLEPGHGNWLNTYYVYDDLDQLRFVFSPKVVELLKGSLNWDCSSTIAQDAIKELCFRYAYDARKRMIAKKVPGAGWVYMVYDRRDRLTYTQDANMRTRNQWMATIYDDMNRPAITGMITYTGNREALQSLLDEQYDAASSTALSVHFSAPDTLFVSQRDPGVPSYRAGSQIVFNPGFSTENGASFETIIGPATVTTSTLQMNYNPLPPSTDLTALTYTYYDDYASAGKSFRSTDLSKLDDGGNAAPEAVATVASLQTKGMVTSTKVRTLPDPNNLEAGTWLETVSFYDDKGRVVQLQSDNIKTGTDITTNRYDFSGRVISSYMVHNNPVAAQTIRTKTNLLYDHAGRVLAVRKTVNDDDATARYLARNTYDELGELKEKQLGQKSASDQTAMELQAYDYTIRGWLKGINRDYTTANGSPGSGTPWFGMQLSYDYGFSQNQFNGNISGVTWRSKGDGEKRAYGYAYDRANRLLFADFKQYTDNGWNNTAGLNFTAIMGNGTDYKTAYDANGNILRMQQWGVKLNASGQIDDLQYDYLVNSNQLKSVFDQVNDPETKLGDFRTSANSPNISATSAVQKTDYNYDVNGNLTKDLNKDIGDATVEGIVYNHLNLPWQVTVKNKGTITYIYDASGNKLEKQVSETSPAKNTRTDYLGAYVYQNDSLQFFGQEEGRVRPLHPAGQPVSYAFDYFIKDHLGNTRMVLTDEQQTDAYPVASMETAQAAVENTYYSKIEETRSAKPPGYPDDTYTNPNDFVSKLNGDGNKIGPGIMLRVMSGDAVNIRATSWYKLNGASPGTPVNPLNDLVVAMSRGISAVTTDYGKITITELQSNGVLTPGIGSLLSQQDASYTENTRPKAYLNWILLDEQFKLVSSSSGFEQVGDDNEFKTWVKTGLPINRNGYLYVYTSNESPVDVFFDNLQVTHVRGPLQEETHYYPFGLTMAGISSKAAGKLENRYKFNGYEKQSGEFSDGSGLEWYDYKHRFYDNQIGRFFVTDALADRFPYYSPYQFAGNEPTVAIDLDGLEPAYVASKNSKGQTKLAFPVAAMYAKLYGNSRFWQAGAEANLVINQSVHDKITGYKDGAITLGHDINYTSNYANANAEDWLKLTAHELTHVEQFDAVFGNDFKSEKEYSTAVVGWMMSYAFDSMDKMIENKTTDAGKLHDKIEIEKGANKNGSLFESFFDSQNYSTKGKDGKVTGANHVIDLLQQMYQNRDNKKEYNQGFNQLMQLISNFQNQQSKK